MNKTKLVYGAVFGLLASVAGSANAAITSPTVVDFGYKPNRTTPDTVLTAGAYYGKANVAPVGAEICPEGDCVLQNSMVIGTIGDPTGPNAHLHQGGSTADRMLAYHNDSGGVYFRADDMSAFSFDSIKISSPYSGENPLAKYLADGVTLNPDHDSTLDYYEILGFDTAFNPDLWNGDGTNYSTAVAYQTIYNGFNDTLSLNEDFRNVKAVWIHYAGAQNVGLAQFPFKVQIDNIAVSAPQVTSVPVPAAVWMFGSGLLGLLSLGRRKPALSA
ncbi:hypothetical protein [Methylomonas rapida]|uniref:Secreted protein n=1 Tax=Methylomonas rapida TaxID=2963939 RepID=A0ABY7GPQ9_9GAMM|nr:hypothetical protein [Methylomonas rapida]WAR46476.1 hypothetical protein NM686_008160 [Methylomonas rapida]